MKKGALSRAQAIATVGVEAVEAVESESCDYTNRLMPGGFEETVEFAASVPCTNADGDAVTLTAYYYQDAADLVECDDLSNLTWTIYGYAVI